MKDGIRSVIDADLESQERLKIKQNEVDQAIAEILRDKLNIQSKVWEDAKTFLESEKVRLKNSLTETEVLAQEQYKENLKKLESRFNTHKEEWIKDIIHACISDEGK